MLDCCLLLKRTIYKGERRGLLIGSGGTPEPSMPRNNYTTEGKASNLLRHLLQFQNLQWAQRAHRPLCSGSCRTFCGVLSHSCQSWYRWLQPPSATVWLAKPACSAGHPATQLSQGTHSYISTIRSNYRFNITLPKNKLN